MIVTGDSGSGLTACLSASPPAALWGEGPAERLGPHAELLVGHDEDVSFEACFELLNLIFEVGDALLSCNTTACEFRAKSDSVNYWLVFVVEVCNLHYVLKWGSLKVAVCDHVFVSGRSRGSGDHGVSM